MFFECRPLTGGWLRGRVAQDFAKPKREAGPRRWSQVTSRSARLHFFDSDTVVLPESQKEKRSSNKKYMLPESQRSFRSFTAPLSASSGITVAAIQPFGGRFGVRPCKFLAVDSFSILFSHRSFQKIQIHFPGFFGGFPERFGSLERMEMEATPCKLARIGATSAMTTIVTTETCGCQHRRTPRHGNMSRIGTEPSALPVTCPDTKATKVSRADSGHGFLCRQLLLRLA